jgi:hypothetical protein
MTSVVEVIAVPAGASIAAEGRGQITSITITERATDRPARGGPRKKRRHEVDALVIEVTGAPSFELAEQAGVAVTFDPARGGYVPHTDENGRALPWLWCAGELAGTGSSLLAIESQAERVALDVEKALSTPR